MKDPSARSCVSTGTTSPLSDSMRVDQSGASPPRVMFSPREFRARIMISCGRPASPPSNPGPYATDLCASVASVAVALTSFSSRAAISRAAAGSIPWSWISCARFRMQGVGFSVQSSAPACCPMLLGCMCGLWFMAQGFGTRDEGYGLKAHGIDPMILPIAQTLVQSFERIWTCKRVSSKNSIQFGPYQSLPIYHERIGVRHRPHLLARFKCIGFSKNLKMLGVKGVALTSFSSSAAISRAAPGSIPWSCPSLKRSLVCSVKCEVCIV